MYTFEILMPNMMVLGGGTLGRWLGHEGKAIMTGISILIKKTLQNSLDFSALWEYRKSVTQKKALA